jgi:hypothetical protein
MLTFDVFPLWFIVLFFVMPIIGILLMFVSRRLNRKLYERLCLGLGILCLSYIVLYFLLLNVNEMPF